MGKQRAIDQVDLVLIGEFLDHFRTALRVGAIVLDNDLERTSIDAAGIVDALGGSRRHALIPTAIGRADARAVALETDLDGLGRLRLAIAHEAGCGHQTRRGSQPLERGPARQTAV